MPTCDNCSAVVPIAGKLWDGSTICCMHCIFNPNGCRCKFGEFGVAETEPEWYYTDEVDACQDWEERLDNDY